MSVRAVFSVVFLLLLVGCSIGSPAGDVVEKEVDNFFKARQQQDVDAVLAYYSTKRSPEEWRSGYEDVLSNLGHVESYRKIRVEVNTVLSGRFYIFDYQVKYKSGIEAKETLTLFDTIEKDDAFSIVAHVVIADSYQKVF